MTPGQENQGSSEGQPDDEPGVQSHASMPSTDSNNLSGNLSEHDPVAMEPPNIPIPDETDDDLICEGLYCIEDDAEVLHVDGLAQAWRCEIIVNEQHIQDWKQEDQPEEMAFLVSAAKKQRAEVRLTTLSSKERSEFDVAKDTEVQNWIKTGTIARIVRDKIPADQILKCRWIFTWKPLDEEDQKKYQKTRKSKSKIGDTRISRPQDRSASPRFANSRRHSKMLMLQLIASMGWDLQSFDIKAAFLQGNRKLIVFWV